MFLLLFSLTILLGDDHILILKNGRKMLCSSYSTEEGHVRIERKGQVFTLPENAIDWEKTKAVNLERTKQAQSLPPKEAAPAPKNKIHFEKPKDRGQIVLTTKDMPEKRKQKKASAVKVPFRKAGNTIIVSVTMNGNGPFDMVMDTGASGTVISPNLARRLGVDLKDSDIRMIGVGGEPMDTQQGVLREIGLDQAIVHDILIRAHSIEFLNVRNIHGLLGQDFFNHFSVTMDNQNQYLTLISNTLDTEDEAGSQAAVAMSRKNINNSVDLQAIRSEYGILHDKMSSIISRAGQLYQRLGYQEPGSNVDSQVRECDNLLSEINSEQRRFQRLHGQIATLPDDSFSERQKADLDRYRTCGSKYNMCFTKIGQFIRDTRMAYANLKSDVRYQRSLNEINARLEEMRVLIDQMEGCQ